MSTVALAGATTGFGLTVLRHFLANNPFNHKIVLLSRSPQPQWTARGVDVRVVDYDSHSSIVAALQGVHTVLSLIGGSAEALLNAQLALIRAAQETGVLRFAPSEYAGTGGGYDLELYRGKGDVWEAVKASGMQYTRFACGLFMSVLATGTPKTPSSVGIAEGAETGEEEALAGLRPWNFVVNVRAGTADVVGSAGGSKIVFTDMRDVAVFVIKALELEEWPEELGMRGSFMTWAEVIEVLEEVQGRKFLVKEDSFEEVEQACEDPGKRFYNQTRLAFARGWGIVGDELNQTFPDVHPTGVKDFVEKWWKGVDLDVPRWVEDKSFM